MTKPMKTTHTPTPEHHKTPLSASEKHRAKFIQLGFTCDLNNKKKVSTFVPEVKLLHHRPWYVIRSLAFYL